MSNNYWKIFPVLPYPNRSEEVPKQLQSACWIAVFSHRIRLILQPLQLTGHSISLHFCYRHCQFQLF